MLLNNQLEVKAIKVRNLVSFLLLLAEHYTSSIGSLLWFRCDLICLHWLMMMLCLSIQLFLDVVAVMLGAYNSSTNTVYAYTSAHVMMCIRSAHSFPLYSLHNPRPPSQNLGLLLFVSRSHSVAAAAAYIAALPLTINHLFVIQSADELGTLYVTIYMNVGAHYNQQL